ncbi:MAG: nuclear transport factor 2 family protein [Gammaproteobacteria bacterium]
MTVVAKTDSERAVLEFFATLSSGNLENVRALLHEDAVWQPQVRDVPGAGAHRGKKGIVDEFLAPVRGLFRAGDPKVVVDTIVSNGPFVMAESHSDGRLADGRPYENLYAWAIEVREGKIFTIREYFDSHYVIGLFATPK